MDLQLSIYDCLCSTALFRVNGVDAEKRHFGEQYDTAPDEAEDYACGNMQFIAKESTPEILSKYGITQDEYEEVCVKLTNGLSFGNCGWCV